MENNMGKRKQESSEYWKKELAYIQSVDPPNNACFKHDPEVFKKYLLMQARFALEDGFEDIAHQMLKKSSYCF
jgi:hypothetical protein